MTTGRSLMRIAVTGSSGLLGSHVAAALAAAGHEVRGIDRLPPPPGATWQHDSADACRPDALQPLLRGVEALVHAAAIPRPTGHEPTEVLETNTMASFAAVEAAIAVGARRLVYASSFSVYGWPFAQRPPTPAYLPIDEAHPIGAQDAYALSKWLGEEIVEAGVRRAGLSAVSLRMPWLHTPASFVAAIPPRLASGGAHLDLWAYLDVRDAADAFVAAVTVPLAGHHRILLSAADSYAPEPTPVLVAAAFPGCPLRRPLDGHAALLDSTRALDLLRWRPRRSWRDDERG